MNVIAISCLLVLLSPVLLFAQTPVTRVSGGSIKTELGMGYTVNKGSTLEREWITVHQALPADLVGTSGVRTIYKSGRGSGEYNYEAELTLEAKESLSAFTVHYLLFDVWGRHVRTLALTEVADVEPGKKTFSGTWRAWSENDVSTYYASISYLARVRTKAGKVITADTSPILAEARKFATKLSAEDLEPKPRADSR